MNHGQIIGISGKKYYFCYNNLPISFELIDITNPVDFRLVCRLDRRSVPVRELKGTVLVFSYVVPSDMREKNWLLGFSQGLSDEIDPMPAVHRASLIPQHWFFFSPFTAKWTPIDMAAEWKSMENSIDFFRRPDLKHSLEDMNAMVPLWVDQPLSLQGLLAWSSEPYLYFLSIDRKRSNIFILDDNSGISYVETLGDRLVFVGRSDGTFDILFFDDFRRTPFHAFSELSPPTDNPVSFMKLVRGPAQSYLLIGHGTTERDIRAFLSIYELQNACFSATDYHRRDFCFEKIGQASIHDPSLAFDVLADGLATESEFILAALFKSSAFDSASVLHTYRVESADIHNPLTSDVLQSIASLEGDFSKALDVYLDSEQQVIFLSDDGPKRVMDLKREDRSYYNLWTRWLQPALHHPKRPSPACESLPHEFYSRIVSEIPELASSLSLAIPKEDAAWRALIQAVQSHPTASAMSKELVYFYWLLELSPELAALFAQSGQLLPEFYDMVRVFWSLDHSENLAQIAPLLKQASSLDISPHCKLAILSRLTTLGMLKEAIEYAQLASIYALPTIHQENLKEAFSHAKLILKLHLSQREILNAFSYYRSVLGQLDAVDGSSYHIVKEELFLLILGAVLDPPDRITPEGITISPVETDDSMKKREMLLSQVPLDASEKNMLCKYCIQYYPNERNHDFLLAYYIAKGEVFEAMLFYKHSKCFPRYLQSCSVLLRKLLADEELKAIIKRYEKRDGYLYVVREELPLHLTKELELYYHGSKMLSEIERTHHIEVPISGFIETAASHERASSDQTLLLANGADFTPRKTLLHVHQALERVVVLAGPSAALGTRADPPLMSTSSASAPSASPIVHRVKVESLSRSPLKRSSFELPKDTAGLPASPANGSHRPPPSPAEPTSSSVESYSISPRARKSIASAMELSPQGLNDSSACRHQSSPFDQLDQTQPSDDASVLLVKTKLAARAKTAGGLAAADMDAQPSDQPKLRAPIATACSSPKSKRSASHESRAGAISPDRQDSQRTEPGLAGSAAVSCSSLESSSRSSSQAVTSPVQRSKDTRRFTSTSAGSSEASQSATKLPVPSPLRQKSHLDSSRDEASLLDSFATQSPRQARSRRSLSELSEARGSQTRRSSPRTAAHTSPKPKAACKSLSLDSGSNRRTSSPRQELISEASSSFSPQDMPSPASSSRSARKGFKMSSSQAAKNVSNSTKEKSRKVISSSIASSPRGDTMSPSSPGSTPKAQRRTKSAAKSSELLPRVMKVTASPPRTPYRVITPAKSLVSEVEAPTAAPKSTRATQEDNTASSRFARKTPRPTAKQTGASRKGSNRPTVQDLTEPLRTTPKKAIRAGTPRKLLSLIKVAKRKRLAVEAEQSIGATPRVAKRLRHTELATDKPLKAAPPPRSLLVAPSPLMSNITKRSIRKSKAATADPKSSPAHSAAMSASSPIIGSASRSRSGPLAQPGSLSKSSPLRSAASRSISRARDRLPASHAAATDNSPSGHVYDLRDRPVHAPESLTFTFPVHPHHHAS